MILQHSLISTRKGNAMERWQSAFDEYIVFFNGKKQCIIKAQTSWEAWERAIRMNWKNPLVLKDGILYLVESETKEVIRY